MARGFAVNADGSYAGWYGHKGVFAGKGFPGGVAFVADDDADPRVAGIRAERDAPPPPGPPSSVEDLITFLVNDNATTDEKAQAKARLLAPKAAQAGGLPA